MTSIMASTSMSNDMRGWILCLVSAFACVFGACVICVDVFIRLIPGKKSFRIQDSNAFLSSSLSLSFGVMIFSSLFSMLPSAKRYLRDSNLPEQTAGFLMMGAFAVGFVGIQVVSRIIHQFMPSHVVDCDHSHGEALGEEDGDVHDFHHSHGHDHGHPHDHGHHSHSHPLGRRHRSLSRRQSARRPSLNHAGAMATESTPLLRSADGAAIVPLTLQRQMSVRSDGTSAAAEHVLSRPPLPRSQSRRTLPRLRRPSMVEVRDRLLSFVKDTKANCDEFGPCYGYSDLCGQECTRHLIRDPPSLQGHFPSGRHSVAATDGTVTPTSSVAPEGIDTILPSRPSYDGGVSTVPEEANSGTSNPITPDITQAIRRTKSYTRLRHPHDHMEMQDDDLDSYFLPSDSITNGAPAANGTASVHGVHGPKTDECEDGHCNDGAARRHFHDHHSEYGHGSSHFYGHHHYDDDWQHRYRGRLEDHEHGIEDGSVDAHGADLEAAPESVAAGPHHHHVPANAFMSIGLQTVLAIGLHKFPEGFITFATNHANPELGFNVFMALFVHNIAEGFAMALPLYMALGSRLRAILWAAALGGLSQPFGAAVAWLWLQCMARHSQNGDDRGSGSPGDSGNAVAYGVLFAVTAGIMTAVALQLFVESLTLHHNRHLSLGFVFVGMMLLGLSNALVKH